MIIRKASWSDKKQLCELFKRVNREFAPPLSTKKGREMTSEIEKLVTRIIKGAYGIPIVFETKGKIKGIICISNKYWSKKGIEKLRNTPHITWLVVHPKHRRRGIATLLLNFAFIWLRNNGYKKVSIRTWSTNDEALKLYKHVGFRIFKKIRNDRGKGIHTLYFLKEFEKPNPRKP